MQSGNTSYSSWKFTEFSKRHWQSLYKFRRKSLPSSVLNQFSFIWINFENFSYQLNCHTLMWFVTFESISHVQTILFIEQSKTVQNTCAEGRLVEDVTEDRTSDDFVSPTCTHVHFIASQTEHKSQANQKIITIWHTCLNVPDFDNLTFQEKCF